MYAGAVANQPGSPDNTEGARQALTDDQHHQRADHTENDLRMDDFQIARRRAVATRTKSQRRAKQGRKRQAEGGFGQKRKLIRKTGDEIAKHRFSSREGFPSALPS